MTCPVTRRILIVGNSHTAALRDGRDLAPSPPGTEIEVLQIKSGRGDKQIGDVTQAEALARAVAVPAGGCIVVTLYGTQHNILGLLNHPQPFTLAAEDGPGPAPLLIPQAAMRSYLHGMLGSARLLADLAAAAACPVYHLMPPPPKRDLGHLANRSKIYRGQDIRDAGFSPAARRLAFWRLERAVVADHLAASGVHELAIPADLCEADGYLAADYQLRDATHANAAYGARLLAAILALPTAPDTGG